MVQSAPIHLTKRSTCTKDNVTELEKRLYCAARDLHDANGQLENYLSSLSEIVIDNAEAKHKTKKIASETFSIYLLLSMPTLYQNRGIKASVTRPFIQCRNYFKYQPECQTVG